MKSKNPTIQKMEETNFFRKYFQQSSISMNVYIASTNATIEMEHKKKHKKKCSIKKKKKKNKKKRKKEKTSSSKRGHYDV